MNRRRRLLVTLTALALVGLPTVAHAQNDSHLDPAKDVLRFEDYTSETPRVPGQRTADIVKIASSHGRDVVAVKITLRDVATANYDYDFRIKTPQRGFYELQLLKYEADEPARLTLWRVRSGYDEVECPGKSRQVDHRADTIRVSVPRDCLDDPLWVRTGAGSNVLAGVDAGYFDDARRKAAYTVNQLALGRRLGSG